MLSDPGGDRSASAAHSALCTLHSALECDEQGPTTDPTQRAIHSPRCRKTPDGVRGEREEQRDPGGRGSPQHVRNESEIGWLGGSTAGDRTRRHERRRGQVKPGSTGVGKGRAAVVPAKREAGKDDDAGWLMVTLGSHTTTDSLRVLPRKSTIMLLEFSRCRDKGPVVRPLLCRPVYGPASRTFAPGNFSSNRR